VNGSGGSPHPRLINLVLAQGISASGDAFLLTAASIAVYRETGSTTAVSLLLGLAALPTVLLDRWPALRRLVFTRRHYGAESTCSAPRLSLGAAVAALLPLAVTVFLAVGVVYTLSTFYRPAPQPVTGSFGGRSSSAGRTVASVWHEPGAHPGAAAAGLMVDRGGFELVLAVDGGNVLGLCPCWCLPHKTSRAA